MTNVTPFGPSGITPEVIAQHIVEDAPNLDSLYVIGFTKEGVVIEYFSGTASGMCLAATILQDVALRSAKGLRR